MKKTFFSFLVMFFLVPSFALCATKEDWVIDDFDSTIVIHQDGIVSVKETINADFGALEKHGIFRLIPVEYTTSDNQKLTLVIEGKPVTDGKSDIPYKTEYVNGNLRLQIGDPNKIISGKQTYVIEYTVRGALREFDAYDELYWNITGNEWPVPIKHVSASFSFPEG